MRATERLVRFAAIVSALLVLGIADRARAADWPIVQGTEVGQPEDRPIRPFGFVQVVGDGMLGGEVNGLSKANAAFDGQRPSFNSLDGGGSWGATVRRARPGLRGAIPGTDQRVSYFFLAELGTAAIARDGPTLTDAAVTFSYVPGARLRVGQFKLPLMDETVEANPLAAEWINYSQPAAQLALENFVRGGKYVGGASGFRDVGAEVFDTFQWNKVALAYALMLSNGHIGRVEDDAAKDVTARTTFSWVFSGKPADPHRQEMSVFAWGQRGERQLDTGSAQRIRAGTGAHLELEPIRLRAEIVYASGVLVTGPTPPFLGQPIAVSAHGRAVGGYVQARVRMFGHLLAGARYDELHRDVDDDKALRVFRTLTPMLEYDVVPHVRLQANYEMRWLLAPHGSADAKTFANAMGDRFLVQATAAF
jgi:hypothetical protein